MVGIVEFTDGLRQSRDYAVDALCWADDAPATLVAAAAEKIRAYGFVVVDHAVSSDTDIVEAVHDEVWAATQLIEGEGGGDRAQDQAGFGGGGDVGVETEVQLRPTCELVYLPKFCEQMAASPISPAAVLARSISMSPRATRAPSAANVFAK